MNTKDVDRKTMLETVMTPIIGEEFVKWLEDNGFLTAPASTKYHGNYDGGLFDHSFATMNILVDLSAKNGLKWQRPESPFIIGMLHDLCKIDNYLPLEGADVPYRYNTETDLKGHGDKSVMMLASHIQLTEEEVMCIRYHMGAFTDKEEWRDYTNAVHKFTNVLWTHQADMLSSHVLGT